MDNKEIKEALFWSQQFWYWQWKKDNDPSSYRIYRDYMDKFSNFDKVETVA